MGRVKNTEFQLHYSPLSNHQFGNDTNEMKMQYEQDDRKKLKSLIRKIGRKNYKLTIDLQKILSLSRQIDSFSL